MEIRNCQFKFKCSMVWKELTETSIPNIRYCTECDKGVHYCSNDEELNSALKNDWCIAIKVIEKDEDTFETISSSDAVEDNAFIMLGDLEYEGDSLVPPVADIPDEGNAN